MVQVIGECSAMEEKGGSIRLVSEQIHKRISLDNKSYDQKKIYETLPE